MQRRRFNKQAPLDQRLEEHAKRLRDEARGTPPGVKRDDLIRRATTGRDRRACEGMGYVAGTTAPAVVGPFSHREQIGTN